MYRKLLLLDFCADEVPSLYSTSLKTICQEAIFLPSEDDSVRQQIAGADALATKVTTKVNKSLLDDAKKLRCIGTLATAYDNIDIKAARSKNIDVCNLGGYSTDAVAEFVFAALFEHLRDLGQAKEKADEENFLYRGVLRPQLKGKTLGVVGAGQIGSRVAEIGQGLGMQVLYFSRQVKPHLEKIGARHNSLDHVMANSDVLAFTLALNQHTEKMISDEKLKLMKQGATLVNIAPMDILDNAAMLKKLNENACTLILDHPNTLPPDLVKQYCAAKNCVIYPMIGYQTAEAENNRWQTLFDNFANHLAGKPLNIIN